jgi:peptidoglycan-associated lipoprotein
MRKEVILLFVSALALASCRSRQKVVSTKNETVERSPATIETKEPVKPEKKKPAEKEVEIKIPDRVFFDFDSAVLSRKSRDSLRAVADWLSQNKKSITVEGHCDERGTKQYNRHLGENRAKAVKDFLVSRDIPANKIKIVSHGKDLPEPRLPGEDIETWWTKNRRSVIVPETQRQKTNTKKDSKKAELKPTSKSKKDSKKETVASKSVSSPKKEVVPPKKSNKLTSPSRKSTAALH